MKFRLAIFASGTGSNATRLIDYFKEHPNFEIAFLLTNKPQAPVVNKTIQRGIKLISCTNQEIDQPHYLVDLCKYEKVDYIVLAGFLRKIPADFICFFNKHIINIHPSLLPKYGGVGMYGLNVHKAVKESGETESGITIHYVSEHFDEGQRIAQLMTTIDRNDTIEQIQSKIHHLEQVYFPIIVEQEILNFNS